MDRCDNCIYWDQNVTSGSGAIVLNRGSCRRNSPKPQTNGSYWVTGVVEWPMTKDTDWCGSHQPKQDPIPLEPWEIPTEKT